MEFTVPYSRAILLIEWLDQLSSFINNTIEYNEDTEKNDQFDVVLNYIRDKFDIILFDAPPINIVTDSMILCNKADGVILVCTIEKSRREALVETKKKILNMGGNIIGCVINRMPIDKMREYTKEYGKYSGNEIIKYTNKMRGIS